MAAARELGRILDIRENLPEETIQQQEDILKAVQKEKTEYIQKSAVEQAGNIEGYVKDKETKQPLVGVNVSLISMKNYSSLGTIPMVGVHISLSSGKRDSSWSMITKTDKNGYFLMSDLSVDHYSVNVSRIGYKTFSPKSGGVRILGASGFDIHFLQVQPNKTTQINFEMIPQDSVGNIEGYVTDKNTGKPLAGVNIFLNDTTYARKDSIPLSGITTFTYDEIINMSASNLRRLLETHSGINVLTNTPYIRKNQPIAVTDEKGYYIIRNVPPGIYSLIAKKEGYFSNVRDSVQVETGKTTRLDFNLTAGVEDIVIQVSKPSGKIDGYVKDKNTGQPIAGVNIFLSDTTSTQKDSIPLSRIKTLSYEEITKMPASDISKLLAAQSSITVLKDTSTEKRLDRTSRVNTLSYEEITKMSVSDISKLLAAQSSITVLTNTPAKKGGYEARDVQDIRMRGGRNEEVALVIDGQVVRNPVFGGFSTSAEQSDVTSRPIAVTDEYGYFVVPNVPPGIYSVIASKTGYKSQTQENVRVTSGVITQIPFELTVIKEPAESVQDTEQKQEYTATVLLSDSTIKKLDNVDFIIPDGAGMTTEGITIIGKNIEIIPPEGDPKIQKMSILEYARTFYLPRDVNKNNKIVYQ